MRNNYLFILFLLSVAVAQAQPTAFEILQKSIKTHDPRGRWQKLKADFDMSIVREKQADRFFRIDLNIPKKSFFYRVKSDTLNYAQGFKGLETRSIDGSDFVESYLVFKEVLEKEKRFWTF